MWRNPEKRPEPPRAGDDGLRCRDVDLRVGELLHHLRERAGVILPRDKKDPFRPHELPAGLLGGCAEGACILRDEVQLRPAGRGKTREGEQVHARVLQRRQDAGPFARSFGNLQVEVLAQADLVHRCVTSFKRDW